MTAYSCRQSCRFGATAFRIRTGVEETALITADGTRYENADIVTLERRAFSGGRTALLVAGVVGGVLFFAYAVAVASLGNP